MEESSHRISSKDIGCTQGEMRCYRTSQNRQWHDLIFFNVITLQSVCSVENWLKKGRGKNRISNLKGITGNRFDWFDGIWERGSSNEKLVSGYIFKPSEFADWLDVGYEIKKGERTPSRLWMSPWMDGVVRNCTRETIERTGLGWQKRGLDLHMINLNTS